VEVFNFAIIFSEEEVESIWSIKSVHTYEMKATNHFI